VRRGWIVVALLLSLGINLGLASVLVLRSRALAHWATERPDFEPGGRLAGVLDLGREDRREFLRVQRRLFDRVRAERDEIRRVRDEIRVELLSAAPDPERLEALLAEVSDHERRVNRAFVDSVLESREVLPPEALERYLRVIERMGPGRFGREGPGRGGERGPPPPEHERRGPLRPGR